MENTVRIKFNSPEQVKRFEDFETVCVMRGEDSIEELDALLQPIASSLYEECNIVVADSETLTQEAKKRHGIILTRHHLFKLREKWIDGREYWIAPRGKATVIRYDLELCLKDIASELK